MCQMDQVASAYPWERLREILEGADARAIEEYLDGLPWSERARAISRLSPEDQERLLTTLAPQDAADLVENLPEHQAADLIELLSPQEAAPIVEELSSDQQADVLGKMEDTKSEAILAEMDPGEAAEARVLRAYDPATAGGLMITEFVSFAEGVAVQEVLHRLRLHGAEYAEYDIQYLYVIDAEGHPVGVLRTRDLLLAPATKGITELMVRPVRTVALSTSLQDLAHHFEESSFFGLPVVSEKGILVGVVMRRAVDEALKEQSENSFLASQGIVGGEEFRTNPLHVRVRRRFSWLSVNVLLNMVSASVIAVNQETLGQVISLAVFLPIISDMSGCAGQQSVAVSIRELSLGLLRPTEILRVVAKESGPAAVNGILLGAVVGVVAALWSGNPYLGMVVGAAQGINIIVAATFGGLLPLVLKRFGFDPALSSGLILTTVTDMCGFLLALTFAAQYLALLV